MNFDKRLKIEKAKKLARIHKVPQLLKKYTEDEILDALTPEEWPGFTASCSTMDGYERRERIRQELKEEEEKNGQSCATGK